MKRFTTSVLLMMSVAVWAQDNYEIEVYESEIQEPHTTMVELHSNFIFGGQQYVVDGVLPTQHMLHETIETTHGFAPWFEAALYLFNAVGNDNRTTFVGSHLRARVAAINPKLPVGLSVSVEAGYTKREYTPDDWTLEIRPIIDKTLKKWYFSFNPVVDRSFHGLSENMGFTFSPCAKASYKITKKIAFGLEYYAYLGSFSGFATLPNQQHQLFAVIDLDFGEDWEVDFGYGLSFTPATDNDIFKVILGHKFGGKKVITQKIAD